MFVRHFRPANGDDERRLLDESESDDLNLAHASYSAIAPAFAVGRGNGGGGGDRRSPEPIEDAATVGVGVGCGASECQGSCGGVDATVGPEASSRRRYRCNSEHREYCTSLLSSYAAPPATEVTEQQHAQVLGDEFQVFGHTILLLLLVTSMFVGGCSFDCSGPTFKHLVRG